MLPEKLIYIFIMVILSCVLFVWTMILWNFFNNHKGGGAA